MNCSNLNGWQRMWILASIIYLVFVVFLAVIDFPKPWVTFLAEDEINKQLSAKTIGLISYDDGWQDVPIDYKGHELDRLSVKYETPKIIKLPNGKELFVHEVATQADLNYVNKDYCDTVIKLTNKKRIYFIGTMLMVWIIPCLAVYGLGLSINWVYRGFRKKELKG